MPTEIRNNYTIYISTHTGNVREVNEDNFVVNTVTKNAQKPKQNIKGNAVEEPVLCGVFDGMGGEKGGFDASEISAIVASEFYKYLVKSRKPIEECIDSYVSNCNRLIKDFLVKNKLNRGGSTFALVYIKDGIAHPLTIGDSRIYLFRGGKLTRISRDHTLAQKKFEANIFTREEAENSPESHMLTKYLGMNREENTNRAEVYQPIIFDKGDKLLICSDGLYDMCSDEKIESILSKSNAPYSIELVDAALENGGVDNITCIVVEIAE